MTKPEAGPKANSKKGAADPSPEQDSDQSDGTPGDDQSARDQVSPEGDATAGSKTEGPHSAEPEAAESKADMADEEESDESDEIVSDEDIPADDDVAEEDPEEGPEDGSRDDSEEHSEEVPVVAQTGPESDGGAEQSVEPAKPAREDASGNAVPEDSPAEPESGSAEPLGVALPKTSTGSPVQRLRDSLLKPSKRQVAVGVALGLLGFAGVTQVRTAGRDDAFATMSQSELVQTLDGLSSAARQAELEVEDLEGTRDALRSDTQGRDAAIAQAQQESEDVGILAGVLPAKGPGLVVTITDPEGRLSTSRIVDGIEELRDAGAEVMEFNDRVRLVASSYVVADDSGLVVDGVRLTSPYVLEAVGDAATLQSGLNFQGGFLDSIQNTDDYGDGLIDVEVEKSDNLLIDSTVRSSSANFAEPDKSR